MRRLKILELHDITYLQREDPNHTFRLSHCRSRTSLFFSSKSTCCGTAVAFYPFYATSSNFALRAHILHLVDFVFRIANEFHTALVRALRSCFGQLQTFALHFTGFKSFQRIPSMSQLQPHLTYSVSLLILRYVQLLVCEKFLLLKW